MLKAAELLRENSKMNTQDKHVFSEVRGLDERRLRDFLQAFYHWHEKASSPAQQCSRSRVLLVCLVIRFAALRLGEALALDDMTDIDAERSLLHVRGKWARDLPLPRAALNRLLELRDAPYNVRAKGSLCRMDPAYVRRMFSHRAQEAGISTLSPTDIRDFREQELLRHGVPLPVVEIFLGRKSGACARDGRLDLLGEAFRQWEYASRTGRHNIVRGRLALIYRGEFSCLLSVTTAAGTSFFVHCSTRTFARLELAEQKEAGIFVRSLQVEVLCAAVEERNCFGGTVTDILECGDEARVMLCLKNDEQQFCAILTLDRVKNLALQPGKDIWIRIRPADFTFLSSDHAAE